MAYDTGPTAFVTGAAGFVGRELVKALVSRGVQVFGLARSPEAAEQVRRAGGIAVRGDLLVPGKWQDEAAAEWVFHIPPCAATGRAAMDANLLEAVADGATRRIVYVADSSCYGPTGSRPITEDEVPAPPNGHPCLMPALDRLDGYTVAGLPIVTALPGCVYGNGGWFRRQIVHPVMAGRRILQFGKTGPWVSPVHVDDCVRALVHLAQRGEVGGRYFVANSEPIRLHDFARIFAREANRPLRAWRLPAAFARLLLGRSLADRVRRNAALSNIRLQGNGFRFRYPTVEQGIEQIVALYNADRTASRGQDYT